MDEIEKILDELIVAAHAAGIFVGRGAIVCNEEARKRLDTIVEQHLSKVRELRAKIVLRLSNTAIDVLTSRPDGQIRGCSSAEEPGANSRSVSEAQF